MTSRKDKVELPLQSDAEIIDVVAKFEKCTLPIEHWTHRAHLAVGITYLRAFLFPSALERIRSHINLYNRTCGDPNGYNETVTQMFLRKLASERKMQPMMPPLHAEVARLSHLCSVDWLYQYYSKERIWSADAKSQWLEPDLKPLDF